MSMMGLLTVVNGNPRMTLDEYVTSLTMIDGILTHGANMIIEFPELLDNFMDNSKNADLLTPTSRAYLLEGAHHTNRLASAINFMYKGDIVGADVVTFDEMTLESVMAFLNVADSETVNKLNSDLGLSGMIQTKHSTAVKTISISSSYAYVTCDKGILLGLKKAQDINNTQHAYAYADGKLVCDFVHSTSGTFSKSLFVPFYDKSKTYAYRSSSYVTGTLTYLDCSS